MNNKSEKKFRKIVKKEASRISKGAIGEAGFKIARQRDIIFIIAVVEVIVIIVLIVWMVVR